MKKYRVFVEETKPIHVQLPDGRMIPLDKLVSEYMRLSKETTSENKIASKLQPGEFFVIDRDLIEKNMKEIRRQCTAAGPDGADLMKWFEEANKIADKNPKQYPVEIETYIFVHDWESITEKEAFNMCKKIGRSCDEVLAALELEMRICLGETVRDLLYEPDTLPFVRIIKCRDGSVGYLGGGTKDCDNSAPADFDSNYYNADEKHYGHTPYAYRPLKRKRAQN